MGRNKTMTTHLLQAARGAEPRKTAPANLLAKVRVAQQAEQGQNHLGGVQNTHLSCIHRVAVLPQHISSLQLFGRLHACVSDVEMQ